MKKFLLAVTMAAAVALPGRAEREFEWTVGAEAVSAYLWRGATLGGLSLQPTAEVGYAGFTLGAWGNIGASDWNFLHKGYPSLEWPGTEFSPELDLYLSYTVGGLTATLTHYFYFDGRGFFDMSNDAEESTQLEASLSYTVSDDLPLTLSWNTAVAGTDGYLDESDGSLRRAWSTYIEASYEFSLPWDVTLNVAAGITPWKSSYTGYEGGFAFNNLTARAEKAFSSGPMELRLFAQPMFNFYVPEGGSFSYPGNFHWALGCGVWF